MPNETKPKAVIDLYSKIKTLSSQIENINRTLVSNIDNPEFVQQFKIIAEKDKQNQKNKSKLSSESRSIIKIMRDHPEHEQMILHLAKSYVNKVKMV